MAIANWVKLDKTQGSGNGTVNVSADVHTGRNPRTTEIVFKGSNVAEVKRAVSQAGKLEFVDVDDTASAPKEGKTSLVIKGVSNAPNLWFSQGYYNPEDAHVHFDFDVPNTYIANSVTVNNGADIPGDPGASSQYEFSITISVPSNTTTRNLTAQLVVQSEDGETDSCTITLAAGDAYIRVTPDKIDLNHLGEAVAVQVESNVQWSIY